MFICDSYTGVTCVDGGCPDALAEEYSEYGYTYTDCSECAYYRGCKDCYFNRESRCVVYDKDIQWVVTLEEKNNIWIENQKRGQTVEIGFIKELKLSTSTFQYVRKVEYTNVISCRFFVDCVNFPIATQCMTVDFGDGMSTFFPICEIAYLHYCE